LEFVNNPRKSFSGTQKAGIIEAVAQFYNYMEAMTPKFVFSFLKEWCHPGDTCGQYASDLLTASAAFFGKQEWNAWQPMRYLRLWLPDEMLPSFLPEGTNTWHASVVLMPVSKELKPIWVEFGGAINFLPHWTFLSERALQWWYKAAP
jgi:hypothetical protein